MDFLVRALENETLRQWFIGGGIVTLTGLFMKMVPKEKIVGFLKPKLYKAGVFVSKFLTLRLGAKAAQKVEENVIVTTTFAISESLKSFVDGLLSDNDTKK